MNRLFSTASQVLLNTFPVIEYLAQSDQKLIKIPFHNNLLQRTSLSLSFLFYLLGLQCSLNSLPQHFLLPPQYVSNSLCNLFNRPRSDHFLYLFRILPVHHNRFFECPVFYFSPGALAVVWWVEVAGADGAGTGPRIGGVGGLALLVG
jgi:hypothetical protein